MSGWSHEFGEFGTLRPGEAAELLRYSISGLASLAERGVIWRMRVDEKSHWRYDLKSIYAAAGKPELEIASNATSDRKED